MLRHRPDEFGLTIDAHGFVPLAQAVQAVRERYGEVGEADVMELIQSPNQHRFEVTERGIRALYGHSFFVEMDGPPMTPPETLYIGTTASAARRFGEEGITPGDRFYVHLSRSRQAAEERSREDAGPVVIEVRALEASHAGVEFYERGEVVLTRHVPSEFVGQVLGAASQGQGAASQGQGAASQGQGAASQAQGAAPGVKGEAANESFWQAPPRSEMTFGRKLRKGTRR